MKDISLPGLIILGARLSSLPLCHALLLVVPPQLSSKFMPPNRSSRWKISMVGRPIDYILAELNSRSIAFSPTASREELEDLLSNDDSFGRKQEIPGLFKHQYDSVYDSVTRNRPTRRKRRRQNVEDSSKRHITDSTREEMLDVGQSPRQKRRQRQRRSSQASQALLIRAVNTSRAIAGIIPDRVANIGNQAMRLASRRTRIFFDELVGYDCEHEAPPASKGKGGGTTSTRERRAKQRPKSKTATTARTLGLSQDDTHFDPHNIKRENSGFQSSKTKRHQTVRPLEGAYPSDNLQEPKPSLHEVLSVLNRSNIAYSPTATRKELEGLVRSVLSSEPSTRRKSPVDSRVDQTSKTHENSRWKETPTQARSPMTKVYRRGETGASGLFEGSQSSPSTGSAPIIVDVVVESFSQMDDGNDTMDVKPQFAKRRYSSREQVPSPRTAQTRSKYSRKKGSLERFESTNEIDDINALPRLLPAKNDIDAASHGLGGARSDRARGKADRKIYSPYRKSDIYVDGLDQFGDSVVKSLESLLWGNSDNEDDVVSNRGSSNHTTESSAAQRTRRRTDHWRDRMEEQFDYVMGIHQDGKYYNRWINQDVKNGHTTESSDAGSYARVDSPRRGRNRRTPDRPLWDDGDSLLSMLFGVDKQATKRNDILHRNTSFMGSGSMIKILRTLLRSSVLVMSGVCRWASVQGSLPKPIVVVGALSAILCSRPGFRVQNLLLSLVALRVVGELLHGYVYEDHDFWDPQEADNGMS